MIIFDIIPRIKEKKTLKRIQQPSSWLALKSFIYTHYSTLCKNAPKAHTVAQLNPQSQVSIKIHRQWWFSKCIHSQHHPMYVQKCIIIIKTKCHQYRVNFVTDLSLRKSSHSSQVVTFKIICEGCWEKKVIFSVHLI